jgi:hypothetical protein
MAGTTVVLSWARTSNQACYEAVCQTKTGRACSPAERECAGNGRMMRVACSCSSAGSQAQIRADVVSNSAAQRREYIQ